MADSIPKSKWERGLCIGKTATRLGGKALGYLSRKPFQTPGERIEGRKALDRDAAALLFQGLGLLRGTALKAAQLFSLETDLLPPEITEELQKSCHQAPPINRALARKIVANALGKPPEELFREFNGQAFAAASLGQVHRAVAWDGQELAVKLQYPGIRESIESDMQLLRSATWPLPDRRLLAPVFEEIEARLLEEVDYLREQENMAFFREGLLQEPVLMPECRKDLSSGTVLAAEYLDGAPLLEWLETGPDQGQRDHVAQTLQDFFVSGLYRLHGIHADPNPGNFLVLPDLAVGVVDFGCVKHFDPHFVALYSKLAATALKGGRKEYLSLLAGFQSNAAPVSAEIEQLLVEELQATGQWISRLYREKTFDFRENPDFIPAGKRRMSEALKMRQYMDINPHFLFLHRTRYGLLRLFERMGARVSFRNPYEYME
ncbi:AarF/ABC1/UbiB kinase family protein [Desulfovibrio sulfodismutans]|uniref:AarF/ABC1/UbiB kinase family protein n=1 Tax=Desulfolutivibrio sulfodismutans TaxID=63561 RepID=A0A7K3NPL1_9BACT|nr:AarF/ABC1/UbiB kinase family protein [Desulfolutivibrio sulfodismutans]NDY57773.1 AarF/ABC1/UbiB kinase family protein [Desulfolutivibrio sulfodismutans]